MKALHLLALAVLGTLFAGCGSMEFGGFQNPNHTLTGTVHYGDPQLLPGDAVLIVRLVDNSNANLPQVIASQTISNPGPSPVTYHLDYTASDEALMRGFNIEARISYGGKLRLYNANSFNVKLDTANTPREIYVNSVTP